MVLLPLVGPAILAEPCMDCKHCKILAVVRVAALAGGRDEHDTLVVARNGRKRGRIDDGQEDLLKCEETACST
ncbi:hypothetical protein [Tessaracoccus lacteus]|uniref:Secreted protein n=1 Tax=Tessaracoccus lacteus TaxID=3041766 RepID=A0ABY8PZB2_9ACTN|nr:hypothetical protein [Tessaracoccus sp. T21]WGT47794.1 hypothetical protein QH948_03180 [Tessaracoccus sp. T21]